MDLKKLFETLNKTSKGKGVYYLILTFLIGILLIIVSSFFKTVSTGTTAGSNSSQSDKTQAQAVSDNSDEELTNLKNELISILSKTEGVGKVDVMIYSESGEEQVPALNDNNTTNTTEEKDNQGGNRKSVENSSGSTIVMSSDGTKTEPLIIKTNSPKITGVLVVAEGAENKLTQLRITDAVIKLFNLTEDKVNVYPMKK